MIPISLGWPVDLGDCDQREWRHVRVCQKHPGRDRFDFSLRPRSFGRLCIRDLRPDSSGLVIATAILSPPSRMVRWSAPFVGLPITLSRPRSCLNFGEGLNPANAENTANYTILTSGLSVIWQGLQEDHNRKAEYDATSQTVTLDSASRLNPLKPTN